MERAAESKHTGFMRHIMGNQARKNTYGSWVTPREKVVRAAAGTHSEMTYIRRIQGTVVQWVELWPIFEVCERDTLYEWVRVRMDAW